jgi:DDE superfamily endonuclease
MDKQLLDLYTDYLISSFGLTTATGLSALLQGAISHDKITRFLSESDFTSTDLWRLVKPLVRQIQSEEAVLIIDDSIEEKLYTDESELICWHFDHALGRNVKGVNFLSCLYHANDVALPVALELIKKSVWVTDKKTGKQRRVCPKTKNDHAREMVARSLFNQLPFRYVLADTFFASAENMVFVKKAHHKDFIFPLKDNRKIALSQEDKLAGRYVSVSTVKLEENAPIEIWLEGVDFPLLLCKQVFTNKDSSQGILYLVTSDLNLSASQMQTIYQKRWKVEVYHKSLKSNASFAKSPTKTLRTQSNHFFACLWAYVKLEQLRVQTKLNHFAMKAKIYQKALASAFEQLQVLKATGAVA